MSIPREEKEGKDLSAWKGEGKGGGASIANSTGEESKISTKKGTSIGARARKKGVRQLLPRMRERGNLPFDCERLPACERGGGGGRCGGGR